MKFNIKYKYFLVFTLLSQLFISPIYAQYPDTNIGVVDLNYILSESDAAVDAAKQIEDIAKQIEEEIKDTDQSLIDEQNELIESQQIMAPAAFEEKRKEYENKVQNYNVTRQEKLMSIDRIVSESRNEVLNALKPILEEIANDNGITVLLEKNSVLLNAENMDITEEALQVLNKKLPSIKVSAE
jgi:outer membrane protein